MNERISVSQLLAVVVACVAVVRAGGASAAEGVGDTAAPLPASAWQVESDVADAYMGTAVAVGDFNGDDYADVVVSAPFLKFLGDTDGRVFVYFGGGSGLPTTPSWTAETDQSGAIFGSGVGAGDFNGDTYDDLAVGALAYDNGEVDEGAVFVWYGSSSGLGASGTPGNADWMAESDLAGAHLGSSVAGAGDVNNDTRDDLLVGGDRWSNGVSSQGVVFAWHGSAGGLGANGNPLNAAWTREGGQAGAWLGSAVAGAGDVNGDNYDDVIVAAKSWDTIFVNAGQALVFYGSASGIAASPAWIGTGYTSNEFFGTGVACAGDLDNDGYDDIAIAETQYTLVWYGSAGGLGPDGDLFNAPWSFLQGGCYRVAGAGDVDNDGYDDLAMSTTNVVRIFLGGESGAAVTPSWSAPDPNPGSSFGAALAGAGNVNGDAYDDIVIGATAHSNPEANEGAAWVYLGNTDIVAATVQNYAANWTGGRVEIHWTLADVVGHIDFEVYRRRGGGDFRFVAAPDIEIGHDGYVLRDGETRPGRTYTYRVFIMEDGTAVAQFEVSISTPGMETRLFPNHPNPFNPATTIRFELATESRVTLTVYDVSGRRIRTLIDKRMEPGAHDALWEGTNDRGDQMSSGVYFLRLRSGKTSQTRAMVLLK